MRLICASLVICVFAHVQFCRAEGDGLRAEYFNAIDPAGTPALTRVDSTINFDWQSGAPDPAIQPDNFSARWLGQVQAQFSETYTFTTIADDGVRLWVNNTLLVDNWTDHPATAASGSILLEAGQRYDILIEYYEHTGSASMVLQWASPRTPQQVVPQSQLYSSGDSIDYGDGAGIFAQYFNSVDLSGLPTISRIDPRINFNWNGEAPAPGVNGTLFSVLWTGKVLPRYSEVYTFTAVSDDGIRLSVNGQLVIDNWTDHPPTGNSGSIKLDAGQPVSIKLEMYQRYGGAVAGLFWSSASTPYQVVPQKQLFPPDHFGARVSAVSATSPACVEGSVWSPDSGPYIANVSALGKTVTGVFLDQNNWFANVPLSPDVATDLTISSFDGTQTDTSQTTVLWLPTDITGKESSNDVIRIRKNDALLLTAQGPGTLMTLDPDGDGIADYTGAPGDQFSFTYAAAGVYTVTARIDDIPVGSLQVIVIDVNLTKPIACELGYKREKDVHILPVLQEQYVTFTSNDLAVSVKGPFSDDEGEGSTLFLEAVRRGTPALISRLGGSNGPIISYRPVDVFTLEVDGLRDAVINQNTGIGATSIVMHPYIPNIVFTFDMFAHSSTFAGGVTHLSVTTSDTDPQTGSTAFKQEANDQTGQTDGVYTLELQMPPDEMAYCFTVQAHQSASRSVTISNPYNINGMGCKIEAPDPLFIIPEINNEDSKEVKELTAPPDALVPYTNVQDIEVWTSNLKNLAYKVDMGNNVSTFYLGLDDAARILPPDRLDLRDIKRHRCGDYPGNFYGHKPPRTKVEFFTWPFVDSVKIPNPCIIDYPEIKELQTAKPGSPILCYEHCRDDVPYWTGIKYGEQHLFVDTPREHVQMATIKLCRLDADGLKENNPDNVNLDTADAPFARTAFPDLTCCVHRPDNGPFDPLTPPLPPCADNLPKPPLAPADKRLGTPARITLRGPAYTKVNVRLTAVATKLRVSLTGYYADDDSAKLFSMTTDSDGRAAEVVYLQAQQPPRESNGHEADCPTGTYTLKVEGMERSWVCGSPGSTDIPFEQVCAYIVSDTEKISVPHVNFDITRMNGNIVPQTDEDYAGSVTQILDPSSTPAAQARLRLKLLNWSFSPAIYAQDGRVKFKLIIRGTPQTEAEIVIRKNGQVFLTGSLNAEKDVDYADFNAEWTVEFNTGGSDEILLQPLDYGQPLCPDIVRVSGTVCRPFSGRIFFVNAASTSPAAPYDDLIGNAAHTVKAAVNAAGINDNVLIARPGVQDNSIDLKSHLFVAGLGGVYVPTATGFDFDFGSLAYVDGTKSGRVFNAVSTIGTQVAGLKITHGQIAENGAGIKVNGGNSFLACHDWFDENTCTAHNGGGIWFQFHTSGKVDTCKFTGNTTTDTSSTADGNGAGLFAIKSPQLLVDNSTFIGNKALGGGGGAAFYESDTVVCSNCSFTKNTCVGVETGGGGILVKANGPFGGGSIRLVDNVVGGFKGSGNSALATIASLPGGGGIMVLNANAVISGGEVSFNSATAFGGGIGARGTDTTSPNGKITISNVAIDNNESGAGGGVGMMSAIESGLSSDPGSLLGGIPCLIDSCTLTSNTCNAFTGGAVFSNGFQSVLTMNGSTATSNRSTGSTTESKGGGVSVTGTAAGHLFKCDIISNTSSDNGGGCYHTTLSSSTYSNCNIKSNAALGSVTGGEGSGGGMHVSCDANTTFNGCDINSNSAKSNGGGFSIRDSQLTLNGHNTVSQNTAGGDGGGIALTKSVPNGVLEAVCASLNSRLTINGPDKISQNTAGSAGGGISGRKTTNLLNIGTPFVMDVNNATITANTAANFASIGSPSGVYLEETSILDPVRATFTNCSFTNHAGVAVTGVNTRYGFIQVNSSTFLSNGGGIVNFKSATTVDSCTFKGSGSTFVNMVTQVGTLKMTSSQLFGSGSGTTGVRVQSSDSAVTLSQNDFINLRLASGSAAVNVVTLVPQLVCGIVEIDATSNYWGNSKGPNDPSNDANLCSGDVNANPAGGYVTNGVKYRPFNSNP
jgi:hypothetical protein